MPSATLPSNKRFYPTSSVAAYHCQVRGALLGFFGDHVGYAWPVDCFRQVRFCHDASLSGLGDRLFQNSLSFLVKERYSLAAGEIIAIEIHDIDHPQLGSLLFGHLYRGFHRGMRCVAAVRRYQNTLEHFGPAYDLPLCTEV